MSKSGGQASTSSTPTLPAFGMPPSALLNSLPTSTAYGTRGMNNSTSSLFSNLLTPQQHKYGGPMLNVNDSDFPSLGAQLSANRSHAPSMHNAFHVTQQQYHSSMPPPLTHLQMQNMLMKEAHQRPAYANLMKQDGMYGPQQQREEFQIANEDFPALGGGISNGSSAQSLADTVGFMSHLHSTASSAPLDMGARTQPPSAIGNKSNEQLNAEHLPNGPARASPSTTNGPISAMPRAEGIQTEPNGRVYNIPPGMLNDQFGMAGLLTFLRAIETDPGIVALALGHDLTTLGLNLNAHEKNLYQSFGGPWADTPCRAADIDVHIPEEYATNAAIREKLPGVKLNRFTDDLLFYIFYTYPGELFQMAAASELFCRDWRYHRDERVWVTRAPYSQSHEQTRSYERGTYYVFDSQLWRKVTKEMTLEYAKLEDRPPMPHAPQPSVPPSSHQMHHMQQQMIMQQMHGGKSGDVSSSLMSMLPQSAVSRSGASTTTT